MFKSRLLFLYLLLVAAACLPSQAQGLRATYPVQVTAFLQPPYSSYLSEYCDPARERVIVTLLNRDLQESEVSVRLHLSISAGGSLKMETRDYNPLPVFRLQAGVPFKISAIDLAPYFQLQNLEASGFFEGRFPEGMIEICFRVYEANTGRSVSQTSCCRAWLTLNRPPLLSLPLHRTKFAFKEPQQFLFQWTPRHQALSHVEYEFTLKEIHDTQTAVENAFAYSPAVFSKTVSGTSLNYTALDPPLLENTTYAWQVRALVRNGFEERNLFENNGYSEIRTFSTGESCKPPVNASAVQEGQYARVNWMPADASKMQAVAYRAQGQTDWHIQKGNADYANLFDLVPGRTYEYRVGTVCADGSVTYGDTRTFRLEDTRKSIIENCGITSSLPVDPSSLLETLNVGDVFKAGDFPVTVTKVEGRKGLFTGTGWTRLPLFLDVKVSVKFTGIQINTDRQLVGNGYVETNYDKNEKGIANLDFLNQGGTANGQTRTGDIWTDVKTGFSIPPGSAVSYDRATGTLTVKDETGKQVGTIPLTPELKDKLNGQGATTLTIQDRDGNIYTLTKDEQGNIRCEKTGSTGNGGAYSGQFDPNGISLREAAVTFSKGNGQYAFDLWRDDYEPVFLIRNKYENINGYLVACKLIPPGRTDKVAFTVTGPQAEKIDPDKIVFRTGTGTQYIAKNGEISITGGKENDAQDLYALYPDGNGKYTTLGKLKVLSYQELNLNLTLVRVKSNRVDPKSVENYLNNIYGPLGIHWTVSEDTDFNYDNENLDSEASGLFSRETPEMKALIAAYRATGRVDKHTLYLFVLKSGKIKEKGMAGDMPRRKQFGYIFTENASDILRTIAHELGHGRFELRHTFDNDYGKLVTGDNLMDYQGGTCLAKWQWDAMFDPALLINPFEEDEAGMSPWLTSAQQDITRLIELHRCALRKGTLYDFPQPPYWPNLGTLTAKINTGNKTYNVMVQFNKDMIGYKPSKLYPELKNGTGYFYLGDCTISVVGVDQNELKSFTSYLNAETSDDAAIRSEANRITQLLNDKKWLDAYYALYQTSPCVLEQIAIKTRLQVLAQFGEEARLEDHKDHVVTSLMESMLSNSSDATQLYNWAKSNPKAVISLYRGVDDENTHIRFIEALKTCFFLNEKNNLATLKSTLPKENCFIIDWSGKLWTEITYGGDLSSLAFDQKETNVQRLFLTTGVNPMQAVGVWVTDGKNSHLESDQLMIIPAIYAKYIEQERVSKNFNDFVNVALQAGMLAGGYTLVLKGSSTILQIAGVLQMVNSAINLTLHSQKVIVTLQKTEEGKRFLELWPTISVTMDVATLSSFVVAARKVMIDIGRDISLVEQKAIQFQIERAEAIVAKEVMFDKPYNFYRLESLAASEQKAVDDIVYVFKSQGNWGNVEPIKVFEYNGNKYVLDGHHRLAAAKKANIDVKYVLIPESQISQYNYKSIEEIISASTEVARDKINF
ncbi:hypothetical protein FACS1894182_11770 [Bacteroidia bacterium]|nr:hypothetical protein FACS1894182_11770 [Bacteroidia bacterium]